MNALMPDNFNLGLGDSTGEDFTSQVAAQNQQLGLLDPTKQGQTPIGGGDLSIGNSAGVIAPNALANPTPSLTSAATLPAGLSTPATQGTTSAASLPSGLSTPNSMNLAAAAPSGMAVGGGIPNPNAIQGPQYAPAGSGMPGAFPAGMTLDSPDYPAFHQTNLDRYQAEQASMQGRSSQDPSAIVNGQNISAMTKRDAVAAGLGDAWTNYWYGGTDWESLLHPAGGTA
jgi:hypothetical protein